MTMPSKIWAVDYERGQTWLQDVEGWDIEHPHAKYIRADIAEGLARALGAALSGEMQNSPDAWAHAEDALARFRAVMSST